MAQHHLLAGDRPPLVVGPVTRVGPATATAGAVVTAGAGSLLVLRSGTTVEVRNDTAMPAQGLWLVSNPATRAVLQQASAAGNLGTPLTTAPAGATTLTLARRTLGPNAQVVPTPPQAIVVGLVDPPAGALLTNGRTGATTNISAAPRDVYVLTVGPGQAGRATPTS
jgi:hypothetical protein